LKRCHPLPTLPGHPVLVGVMVKESLFNYKSGVVPVMFGQVVGYHAVVIVGHNAEEDWFQFANSWGTSWGEKGLGRVSTRALTEMITPGEIWSVSPVR
jgi:hypothetical protein